MNGAMVTKSTDQTTANYSTVSALAFNAEVYDVGGWHDNSTNNSRLTVPSGVDYVVVTGSLSVSNLASNEWMALYIYKNGSVTFDGAAQTHVYPVVSGTFQYACVRTGAVPVTAGDYFELFLRVETDTSITVETDATFFSILDVS